jgi:arginyl-tRNA synthetase
VNAALEAMGKSSADLDVVLVQFAVLMRDGAAVAMSTRSGNFVTLRDLVDEVGVDAARFFYLMRRSDQHMEFDLSLAVSKTNENPVYYVQYAHARICSIMTQAASLGDWAWAEEGPKYLSTPAERKIATMLAGYPEVLISAVKSNEPHLLPQYLRELAQEFHAYYNSNKVLSEDKAVRFARLSLVDAVRQVLANGLGLLNISAPRSM